MNQQPYHLQRTSNRFNSIDTHELLKREIYKDDPNNTLRVSAARRDYGSTSAGVTSGPAQQAPIQVGFENTMLFFDSYAQDPSNDTIGEIKWSISTFNSNNDIHNCIKMQIGSFFFPKLFPVTGHPEVFYFRRVYMEVVNMPINQSVNGSNNKRYHFEFDVENLSSQAVKLVPVQDTFILHRPLNSLSEFSCRFMVPSLTMASGFTTITIPKEFVSIQMVLNGANGYNPIRFEITSGESATSVLQPIGVIESPGIATAITDFASNSTSVNDIVNSTNGVYVTNIISGTVFEIAGIDATAVTTAATANMRILKNRIAFPLQFTTVTDHNTNYIKVIQ